MKVRMLVLAGAAVCFAGAALADDPMANTYTNSVVAKDKTSGMSATYYFNKDMSFTGKAMDAKGQPVAFTGTWTLKDDGKTICLSMAVPAGATPPPPSCTPVQSHNVGDTWTVTNDQKMSYDVTLVSGR